MAFDLTFSTHAVCSKKDCFSLFNLDSPRAHLPLSLFLSSTCCLPRCLQESFCKMISCKQLIPPSGTDIHNCISSFWSSDGVFHLSRRPKRERIVSRNEELTRNGEEVRVDVFWVALPLPLALPQGCVCDCGSCTSPCRIRANQRLGLPSPTIFISADIITSIRVKISFRDNACRVAVARQMETADRALRCCAAAAPADDVTAAAVTAAARDMT